MKRFISALLAVAMTLSVAGCGSSSSTASSSKAASTASSAASSKASSTASSTAASGTVKIGLVTAVTGSNSLVGEESTNGAKLAIDEINAAGGVNGQKLELVISDEVDNADQSVLATQELISNKNVMAIIGSLYSQYCIAALPSILDAKIPYFCSGSSSGVSKQANPYTWQVRPLDTAQGKVLADFVVNTLKCKNPAILYSTQSTFASLEEQTVAALKDLGVNVPSGNLFGFPENESNYSSYLTQILGGGYDCLIAMANQAPSAVICQQAEAAGIDTSKLPCVGSTSFCSSVCIKNAGSSANGWYSVSDWVPGGTTTKAAAFEKAYVAKYNVASDLAAVAIYDAVYVIAKAMTIAGTNTDKEAINTALQKIDMEGCISQFKFNTDHSFATALSVTQNKDQKPVALKSVSYR